MFFSPIFNRVQDGKLFRLTLYAAAFSTGKKRDIVSDSGESDTITWVTDSFFVSGETGHTFVPVTP